MLPYFVSFWLNGRNTYLGLETERNHTASLMWAVTSLWHRRTGNVLPGGGGKPFAQKNLASCPNFYERVEKK